MIIPGSTINVPVARPQAKSIMDSMRALVRSRRNARVTRGQFLRRWDKLRTALFLTPEYQQLRSIVFREAGGLCSKCEQRPAQHLHHKVRVALNPMMAMIASNCEARCRECHKLEDHS